MQIIEINEPGTANLKDEIVLGIDFGTTNSLIAYSKKHQPNIIRNLGNNGLLPSAFVYDDLNDRFLIGSNRDQKGAIL